MSRRYDLPIPKAARLLSADDRIVSLGSCFAQHMGKRLAAQGFSVVPSPFDPLYHPIPLAEIIDRALAQRMFGLDDLRWHPQQQTWHLTAVHGRFHHANPDAVLEQANSALLHLGRGLANMTVLMVTFGTGQGYYHRPFNAQLVGNCHRFSAQEFDHRLTPLNELVACWQQLCDRLWSHQPQLHIIATVSPVRYGHADPHAHSCSKASLHLLIDALQANYPIWYFPAYEIWCDELRDYDNYADDLRHPNEASIDYAWQRFVSAAMNRDCRRQARGITPST